MRLYHYTNVDTMTLVPYVGDDRHGGEDPRAVGRPAVWLTTMQMRSNPPKQFQCVVDVDESDPELFLDEPFAAASGAMEQNFGSGAGRWYWLEHPIEVIARKRWSAESRSYEPIASELPLPPGDGSSENT